MSDDGTQIVPVVTLWQLRAGVWTWRRVAAPFAVREVMDGPENGRGVERSWIEWGTVNPRLWDMSA